MAQPTRNTPRQIVVVGGGAAGFFAAITAAETNPQAEVSLLERSAQLLAKVRISGGGRCNVTHASFDPAELTTHYPRGGAALRGPFTRFQPRDTMEWFQSRGVPLKTEEDNRIFPVSDRSESIMECLQTQAERAGVRVRINTLIQGIQASGQPETTFQLEIGSETTTCDRLILATGSSPQGWEWAQGLGHTLVRPIPSLFTFTVQDPRLDDLSGLSVQAGEVFVEGIKAKQKGPVLITHWGLSGPAVIKLSAWAARELHERAYTASLHINWMGERLDTVVERLKKKREIHPENLVAADNLPQIPRRLWARLAVASKFREAARWAEVGNEAIRAFAKELTDGVYPLTGKSAFKEEFVTCGGVSLNEVDFRTLESKRCPGLFFAGEVLDIDGETGGFNFQSAWTTGWIAGQSAAQGLS